MILVSGEFGDNDIELVCFRVTPLIQLEILPHNAYVFVAAAGDIYDHYL